MSHATRGKYCLYMRWAVQLFKPAGTLNLPGMSRLTRGKCHAHEFQRLSSNIGHTGLISLITSSWKVPATRAIRLSQKALGDALYQSLVWLLQSASRNACANWHSLHDRAIKQIPQCLAFQCCIPHTTAGHFCLIRQVCRAQASVPRHAAPNGTPKDLKPNASPCLAIPRKGTTKRHDAALESSRCGYNTTH